MPITLSGNNGVTGATWTTATRPSSPTQGQSGYNTTTNCVDTYNGSSWTSVPQPTTQGTSGQYLQSAGAGAAPTWATLSSTGALIRAPQILTSGTSYTTPSNCTAIYLEMWGAGGSGAAYGGAAGGGGGGAYLAKYATVTGSTAYTYAIAAGAQGASVTGGPNNAGTAAGNTTFTIGATTYTAGGGGGGGISAGTNAVAAGGAGGTATNGDINLTGCPGTGGTNTTSNVTPWNSFPWGILSNSTNIVGSVQNPGAGGSTVGPLARPSGGAANGGNNGQAGQYYGAGGAATTGGFAGAGYQGLIRIWEYT